jgi:hypothetical protein
MRHRGGNDHLYEDFARHLNNLYSGRLQLTCASGHAVDIVHLCMQSSLCICECSSICASENAVIIVHLCMNLKLNFTVKLTLNTFMCHACFLICLYDG